MSNISAYLFVPLIRSSVLIIVDSWKILELLTCVLVCVYSNLGTSIPPFYNNKSTVFRSFTVSVLSLDVERVFLSCDDLFFTALFLHQSYVDLESPWKTLTLTYLWLSGLFYGFRCDDGKKRRNFVQRKTVSREWRIRQFNSSMFSLVLSKWNFDSC